MNDGTNGTGGLLIMYSNNLHQSGIIESCGTQCNMRVSSTTHAFGGSSGGGSINIFYKNKMTKAGKNSAYGGGEETLLGNSYKGGNGRKRFNNNRKHFHRNIYKR